MNTADSRPSATRRVLRVGGVLALTAVALSIALRLTVRDRVPGLAAIFYATPAVLDGVTSAVVATIAWRLGHARAALAGAALALVCGALYAQGSFVRNETGSPGAFRGVFWNAARGRAGWSSVAETSRALEPDVLWLAEAGDADGGAEAALAEAFPGRSIVRARGGLLVQVRGEATLVERTSLLHSSRMALVHLQIDGREFDSLQVDLASDPTTSRLPAFQRIERFAAPHCVSPLLVLGDFNTPRDSSAFDSWRGTFHHAFETAGHGLDATWPAPVPVLSLDHVWAAGGIAVRTCELPFTWQSDHLPVVFTFDLP